MSNASRQIAEYVHGAEDDFKRALADPSLSFEREAGFAIQIMTANDYMSKLAVNDRQSVVNAVTNVAAIGISLNPAKKQAYLVPRKGKICLDISYMGLIDLAIDSGSIMWAQAELVHSGDAFALNGFDKPPTHSYNPFSAERGEMVGAYVVVKTHTGDYLTACMSKGDIDAIKNRSESVKAGKSSPWDTDYGEMAKKTVVKRAYKYWPKSERLDQAIHHLNTEGGEGLAQVQQPAQPVQTLDPTQDIEAVIQTKTDAEALRYWKENQSRYASDLRAHAQFKEAVVKHRNRLKEQNVTDVEVKE
ncbi:MAG: recombination and repair protein RecT [Bacteriophage sp.]|nr:MAG: recombination and repair protein RecT [Bacteriophage sp.]